MQLGSGEVGGGHTYKHDNFQNLERSKGGQMENGKGVAKWDPRQVLAQGPSHGLACATLQGPWEVLLPWGNRAALALGQGTWV